MNHQELKAARDSLGLTPAEAALMLDLQDAKTIYRMESDPDNKSSREAPVRVVRLYRAYLDGHRPADWPQRLTDLVARRAAAREVLKNVRPEQ